MDKFTHRSLLVGGAILSKVTRPRIYGSTVVNSTDTSVLFPAELAGTEIRLNVIRSNLGTNQIYTINFISTEVSSVIDQINRSGRTIQLGVAKDIFRAEISDGVLLITLVDIEADGLEVLESTAATVLGFFPSPDIRGISLIENWRYSVIGDDRQEYGVGTYLVKYEDRTSESINRAVDSVAQNAEELERFIRIPKLIELESENFNLVSNFNNNLQSVSIYEEGIWIEGPLDHIRKNYSDELIDNLGEAYFTFLTENKVALHTICEKALDLIELNINVNTVSLNIVQKLRQDHHYYTVSKGYIDQYGEHVEVPNENTSLIVSDEYHLPRPWKTNSGYNVILATNPYTTPNLIVNLASLANINSSSNKGISFGDGTAMYSELCGSFLGPKFNIHGTTFKVSTATVLDYLTLNLDSDLINENELRVSLESPHTELLVLTNMGVFEVSSIKGRKIQVIPFSGDHNRFLLSPTDTIFTTPQILTPKQTTRVVMYIGRKLPLGMYSLAHDNNSFSLDVPGTESYLPNTDLEIKKLTVFKFNLPNENYLSDHTAKKDTLAKQRLYKAIDPYKVINNSSYTSLRNLYACSNRFVTNNIDLIPATSDNVYINMMQNLSHIGSNLTHGLVTKSNLLHGITRYTELSQNFPLRNSVTRAYALYEAPNAAQFNLSGIVKNIYTYVYDFIQNQTKPVSLSAELSRYLDTRQIDVDARNVGLDIFQGIYGNNFYDTLYDTFPFSESVLPHPSDPELRSDKLVDLKNIYTYILNICPYSPIPKKTDCTVNLEYGIVVTLPAKLTNTLTNTFGTFFDPRDIGRVFYLHNRVGLTFAAKLISIGNPREGRFNLVNNDLVAKLTYLDTLSINKIPMQISLGIGVQSTGHSAFQIDAPAVGRNITVLNNEDSAHVYAVGVPKIVQKISPIDLNRFGGSTVRDNELYNSIETRKGLTPPVAIEFFFSYLDEAGPTSRYPINVKLFAPVDTLAFYHDFTKQSLGNLGQLFDPSTILEAASNIENPQQFINASRYSANPISLWEKIPVDGSIANQSAVSLPIEEAKIVLSDLLTLTNTGIIDFGMRDFLEIILNSREHSVNTANKLFEYLESTVAFPRRITYFNEWLAHLASSVDTESIYSPLFPEKSKKALLTHLAKILSPLGYEDQHTDLSSTVDSTVLSSQLIEAFNSLNYYELNDLYDLTLDTGNDSHIRSTINTFIYVLLLSGVDIGYKYESDDFFTYLTYDNFGKKAAFYSDPSSPKFAEYIQDLLTIFNSSNIDNATIRLRINNNTDKEGLSLNVSNIMYVRDIQKITNLQQNLLLSNQLVDVENGIGEHPTCIIPTAIDSLRIRPKSVSKVSIITNGERTAPLGYSIRNASPDSTIPELLNYTPLRSKGIRPWYFSDIDDPNTPGVSLDLLSAVEIVRQWKNGNPSYSNLKLVHKIGAIITIKVTPGNPNEFYWAQTSMIGFHIDGDVLAEPEVILFPIKGEFNREDTSRLLNAAGKLEAYNDRSVIAEELAFRHCTYTQRNNIDGVGIPAQDSITGNGVLIYPEFSSDNTNCSRLLQIEYTSELYETNLETKQALSHFYNTDRDNNRFVAKATVELESAVDTSNTKKIRNSDNNYKNYEIRSSTHKTISSTFGKAPLVRIAIDDTVKSYSKATRTSSALEVHSNSTDALRVGLTNITNADNDISFGENPVSPTSGLFVYSYGNWESIDSAKEDKIWENDSDKLDVALIAQYEARNWHNLYASVLAMPENHEMYMSAYNGDLRISTRTVDLQSYGGPVLAISNALSSNTLHPKQESTKFRNSALVSINTKDYLHTRTSLPYLKFDDIHYKRKEGNEVGNTKEGFGYPSVLPLEDEYDRSYNSNINDSANIASLFSLGTNKIQGILRISGDVPDSIYDQCNLISSKSINSGVYGHLNPVEAPRASRYWSYVTKSELSNKLDHYAYLKQVKEGIFDASRNLFTSGSGIISFNPQMSLSPNSVTDITLDPRKRFGNGGNAPSQLGEKLSTAHFGINFTYGSWDEKRVIQTDSFGPVYVKNGSAIDNSLPINLQDKLIVDQGISINYFMSIDKDVDQVQDGFRFILARPNLSFGKASIGRSIVFRLTGRFHTHTNPVISTAHQSPYFDGIIADIIVHDGSSPDSVPSREGTVEVIVVPSARRFDRTTEVQRNFPFLIPKNFYEVDPELVKLRNQNFDNINAGAYVNLIARCASDYNNQNDRVHAWDYAGATTSNIVNPELHAIFLEGVIHGREWTLNAFQAAISDRLYLLNDLGDETLNLFADTEGDVHIEGNGDNNLIIDGFDKVTIENLDNNTNVSVIVTCAMRRFLRRITEYEYDLNSYLGGQLHDAIQDIYEERDAVGEKEYYYLVQDEGLYTKMSYDWTVNGSNVDVEASETVGLNNTHSVLPDELKELKIDFNYISQYLGFSKQIPVNVGWQYANAAIITMQMELSSTNVLPNGNTLEEIPFGTHVILKSNAQFIDTNNNNLVYKVSELSVDKKIFLDNEGNSSHIFLATVNESDEVLFSNNHNFVLDIAVPNSYDIYYPNIYVHLDASNTTVYNDSLPELVHLKLQYESYKENVASFVGNTSLTTRYNDNLNKYATAYNNALAKAESNFNNWKAVYSPNDEFTGDIFNWLNGDGANLSVDSSGLPVDTWTEHSDILDAHYKAFTSEKQSAENSDYSVVELKDSAGTLNYTFTGMPSLDEEQIKKNFASKHKVSTEFVEYLITLDYDQDSLHQNNPELIQAQLKQSDVQFLSSTLVKEKITDAAVVLNYLGVLSDQFWCNWFGTGDSHYNYPYAADIHNAIQNNSNFDPTGYILPVQILNNTWGQKWSSDLSMLNKYYRGMEPNESHPFEYPLAGILNALKYPIVHIPKNWEATSIKVSELAPSVEVNAKNIGNIGEPKKHRRKGNFVSGLTRRLLRTDGTHITSYNGLNKKNDNYLTAWRVIDQDTPISDDKLFNQVKINNPTSYIGTVQPTFSVSQEVDTLNDFTYHSYSARQNLSNHGRVVFAPEYSDSSPLFSFINENIPMWTQTGPTATYYYNRMERDWNNFVPAATSVSPNDFLFCTDKQFTGGVYGVLGRLNGLISRQILPNKTIGLELSFDIEKINSLIGNAHAYTSTGLFWEDEYLPDEETSVLLNRTNALSNHNNGSVIVARKVKEEITSNDGFFERGFELTVDNKDNFVDAIIKFKIDIELTKKVVKKSWETGKVSAEEISAGVNSGIDIGYD